MDLEQGPLQKLKPCHTHGIVTEATIATFFESVFVNKHAYRSFDDIRTIFPNENPRDYEEIKENAIRENDDLFFVYDAPLPRESADPEDDRLKRLVRALNQRNRGLLVYNELEYHDWNQTVENLNTVYRWIAAKQLEFPVSETRVFFLNQFLWDGAASSVQRELVFKKEYSEYLPAAFFNKLTPRVELVFMEEPSKQNNDAPALIRVIHLNINIGDLPDPEDGERSATSLISISTFCNIQFINRDSTPKLDVCKSEDLEQLNQLQNEAHNRCQELLSEILSDDALNRKK